MLLKYDFVYDTKSENDHKSFWLKGFEKANSDIFPFSLGFCEAKINKLGKEIWWMQTKMIPFFYHVVRWFTLGNWYGRKKNESCTKPFIGVL